MRWTIKLVAITLALALTSPWLSAQIAAAWFAPAEAQPAVSRAERYRPPVPPVAPPATPAPPYAQPAPAAGMAEPGAPHPALPPPVPNRRNLLIGAVQRAIRAPTPPSLGAGVFVTVREPAMSNVVAMSYAWMDSVDALGGNASGGRDARAIFVLTIRPTPGKATVIDCQIAETEKVTYRAGVLTQDGDYGADSTSGELTGQQPFGAEHWVMVIPWTDSFSARGVFRLFVAPKAEPQVPWSVRACEVAPIL